MKKYKILTIILAIALTELAGFIGMRLAGPISSIYADLNKPPLAPPSEIFGFIWPILYLLMGISLYLIYNSPKSELREKALILFIIQLLVNILWPIVFFKFQTYWLAAIVIIILDILVAITIKLFKRINEKSAYLLYPYLMWIIFATYLNLGFALLN